MEERNRARNIATIAIFAALSVFLNISPLKLPAPFAPYLIYQIWEIPIVTAFLLFGPVAAVTITVLNTIILMGVFPGPLPAGPLYNLAAVLSMLLGIYVVQKLVAEHFRTRRETMLTATSTILGIVARVGVMSIVNWIFLPFP
jgi:riboflavin transporter FmnP